MTDPWDVSRWRVLRRRDRKRLKRTNDNYRKQARRVLDAHDYWSSQRGYLHKRKSEGRNARLETWRARQPFDGRLVWNGNLVCIKPATNLTISL